jgi:hypothetical protein
MARSAWRLPGYRVEELIGSGSSGEVWRGRVAATGVAVALKRIWLSDRAQRKDALSEAAMLSALDHPHLMALHDVRSLDDAIVLVLDLAAGGSLAALLARRGRLTVGETITAIAPIGAALAYAHNAGVVHGDVSGANILFTDIGLPLLADLGVARLLGDAHPVRTTPAYADPAVIGGSLPGPASDVFMLGAVALHTLTGSPPWDGADADELRDAAESGAQPDFGAALRRAGVSEAVAGIVARALSVDPARRGTAAEFALELRHAAQPVAVELTAGRARTAAVPPSAAESASSSAGGNGGVSRPRQPLTMGVRAPSPFAPPEARHRAHSRPRVATGLMVCVTALALALCTGVWWWRSAATDPASAHAAAPAAAHPSARSTPHPTARSTGQHPSGPATAPSSASSPARSSAISPAGAAPARALAPAQALAVLSALDDTRSRAYATRNPALLAAVYASANLLARDRAQLLSIVPMGCGLQGLHTRFSRLALTSASVDRARLRVTATLAPAGLVCAGTASGATPAARPTGLVLDLVRVGTTYRIAAASTDPTMAR